MLKFVWLWIVRPFLLVVSGQALFMISHHLGFHPEEWIAETVLGVSKEDWSAIIAWALVLLVSAVLLWVFEIRRSGGVFKTRLLGMPLASQPEEQTTTETPERPSFQAETDSRITKEGDYERICALKVTNMESRDLDKCLVQIKSMTVPTPDEMPMPLVLRTEGQIRRKDSGRFMLSAGQSKTVPILFRRKDRRNEWYLFDEHGNPYFIPFGPIDFDIGIYGGAKNVEHTVALSTGQDWSVAARDTDDPKPDWRIGEAMDYVADLLGQSDEQDVTKKYHKPAALLTQAVRSGRIKAWGKRCLSKNSAESSARPIPEDEWQDQELMPDACQPHTRTAQTRKVGRTSAQLFTDIHVNKHQIQAIRWQSENT